jgi:GT2 family glycosyltransferase
VYWQLTVTLLAVDCWNRNYFQKSGIFFMRLSIVIVNYNTFAMTCDCINSLYARDFRFPFEIILVDNKSTEQILTNFSTLFPNVHFIQSPVNAGFAAGNNLGLTEAQGDYVLLLNSDTIVDTPAIEYCLDFMDQTSSQRVGMVGCQLYYGDGGVQLSSFDHRIGLWSTLLDNSLIHSVRARLGLVKDYPFWIGQQDTRHYTQALLGAFMLCRKRVLNEVGALDADFFMYYEEFEWCYRITNAGYKIQFLPEARITHLYGGTSHNATKLQGKSKLNKQSCLSRMLLIYKRFGRFGLAVYNFIWWANKMTVKALQLKYSSQHLADHLLGLEGYDFAKSYQSIMTRYYKPFRNSAAVPFSLAQATELREAEMKQKAR